MTTKYAIYWDNGASACGEFPWVYDTEEEAQAAADAIQADNLADGTWGEEGGCEVIEVTEEESEALQDDELALLQKAGLSRGQP